MLLHRSDAQIELSDLVLKALDLLHASLRRFNENLVQLRNLILLLDELDLRLRELRSHLVKSLLRLIMLLELQFMVVAEGLKLLRR